MIIAHKTFNLHKVYPSNKFHMGGSKYLIINNIIYNVT